MVSEKHASTTLDWVSVREKLVQQAIDDGDLAALRRLSALPGGYGSEAMRRRVWPILLQTDRLCSHTPLDEKPGEPSTRPHKDEPQVALDTNRSFVSYPSDDAERTGIPSESKEIMQADLNHLIVGVLRRYPELSYFQGFHDILSVFYLTFLPPVEFPAQHSRSTSLRGRTRAEEGHRAQNGTKVETEGNGVQAKSGHGLSDGTTKVWRDLRNCADVVSICRVRDAMGRGMEGMMGMLKILKRILKAADPDLSRFSAQISPVPTLPFFALSWIMCLFSHDVDTLEPVQRMFDFLLARNPVAAIYLAVAILMLKKPQMLKLASQLGAEAQDDPSLLHPLFSRLPPLFPDTPKDTCAPKVAPTDLRIAPDDDEPNPYQPILLSEVFQLTDSLMVKYPWDGAEIRANEIMGPGSVIHSYQKEVDPLDIEEAGWSLRSGLALIDRDVVLPGATEPDEDGEPAFARSVSRPSLSRWVSALRMPRSRFGTAIAVGIVVLGIGVALSGWRAGGLHPDWSSWWGHVVRSWGRRSLSARVSGYWSAAVRLLDYLKEGTSDRVDL